MPSVIALDVSLSMNRHLPGKNEDLLTYHQLAVQGIHQFLDHLTANSKLEFVSLVIYSMLYEVVVDFTRDYELIRQALKKIEHYDKTSLENMLQAVSNILSTNWGTQNYCQVLVFTDCGIGFGATNLKNTILNIANKKNDEYSWIPFLASSKLSFVCIGSLSDTYFTQATQLYQQFLDVTGQKGQLFIPKSIKSDSSNSGGGSSGGGISNKNGQKNDGKNDLNRTIMNELIERMCEINFKPFDAILKCGEYFKLECPIFIWPPPMPYKSKDNLGQDIFKIISKKLEICGFLSLSDIGSPVSVSRHLIVPKIEPDKFIKKSEKKHGKSENFNITELVSGANEYEKLENEIRGFYAKGDGNNSDDEDSKSTSQNESNRESVCVLLHGALKVENMAALVLLNDNWFGFIYSYADSKKKSNLMLNVLPPGHDVIPWIGDLRLLGSIDDALPGENPCFPVKPEKRSYSQNCVVWIKQAGLQSDIQKVLRHARKLPDKTLHFYKELNRIRRAALSLGFIELLEGLSNIFEREIAVLPQNASPDCAIQLKHAALELRKIANRDLKTLIIAQPTKYNNQLQ